MHGRVSVEGMRARARQPARAQQRVDGRRAASKTCHALAHTPLSRTHHFTVVIIANQRRRPRARAPNSPSSAALRAQRCQPLVVGDGGAQVAPLGLTPAARRLCSGARASGARARVRRAPRTLAPSPPPLTRFVRALRARPRARHGGHAARPVARLCPRAHRLPRVRGVAPTRRR